MLVAVGAWDTDSPLTQRFELLEELGRGGMGVVHRARERSSGREVALKQLQLGALDPELRQRFRREAELAAALRHPGIVTVHAAGEEGVRGWIACELVPGARPLDAAWRGRDRRARVELLREVALALGHAHAQGVVHRDVKAQNLLVDVEGRVRVADFGLALAQDETRLTETGALLGTPHAMAPEQARGEREAIGPWTDVWALGVLLYEALTDQRPFQAPTVLGLLRQIMEDSPRSPRQLDPTIPPALEAVCLRALQKDPSRRQPDGTALAGELEAALAGLAPPRSATRAPAVFLGGLGLACLGLIVLVLRSEPAGPQQGPPAEPAPVSLSPSAGTAPTSTERLAPLLEQGRSDPGALWAWVRQAREAEVGSAEDHRAWLHRALEKGLDEAAACHAYAEMLATGYGGRIDAARALEVLWRPSTLLDPACWELKARLEPDPHRAEFFAELALELTRPGLPAPTSTAELVAQSLAIRAHLDQHRTDRPGWGDLDWLRELDHHCKETARSNTPERPRALRMMEALVTCWGDIRSAENLASELGKGDRAALAKAAAWYRALILRMGNRTDKTRYGSLAMELGLGDPREARKWVMDVLREQPEAEPRVLKLGARMLVEGFGDAVTPETDAQARQLLERAPREPPDPEVRALLEKLQARQAGAPSRE